MRVAPLDVNYLGTTGYLAFWAGDLRSVYTMASEEPSDAAYETYTDAKGVWIYYPMHFDEYVIKICRRPFSGDSPSSTLLVCRLAPHFILHRGNESDRFTSLSRTERGF